MKIKNKIIIIITTLFIFSVNSAKSYEVTLPNFGFICIDKINNEKFEFIFSGNDDDTSDITATVREDILDQGEDTLTFLGNYIEQIDTDLDRKQLKDFVHRLYKESQE